MKDSGTQARVWRASDGTVLALAEVGAPADRPLVLLHGLMSSASLNWIKFGTADRLSKDGIRCIMPDLRGHGDSDAPLDPGRWPRDILVRDAAEFIAAEALNDFDLCGFSLGARIAARLVADGARPRRLILAGMGLEGFTDWERRRRFFLDVADRAGTVRHGDPAFFAAAFMKSQGMAPEVLRNILSSVPADPVPLERIAVPTLVLCGREDRDNGDPQALADALPNGRYETIPGNHMNCIAQPEFGDALSRFVLT